MSWGARRFEHEEHHHRESESTHHRKPRALGGKSDNRNLTELPISKHRAWHTLFRDFDPIRICQEINERYLDPDWEMTVYRKMREEDV